MKQLLIILIFAVALQSCKSDDDQSHNPVDLLPPATQTGEHTFGCLINGEPFVPPNFGSNAPSAFYQFVDGAYTLGISAGTGGGENSKFINMGGLDVLGIEETQYQLIEFESGNFFAEYFVGGGFVLNASSTSQMPGTLQITFLDEINGIISGTFEFTVTDNDGVLIEITEGRFDLNYTN